jgi:LmbE family N-acetylglucosaminyl deacetylase
MPEPLLRLLVIGAHPDDAEYRAGGLAAQYRRLGHVVKFVSVTDGGAGHQSMPRDELIRRRRAEAQAAGQVCGIEYEVWDCPDGELEPIVELRRRIIRLIRSFQPDLLLTHRPYDYHPDHRYTSQLVQDAAFMVTVPKICSDTPHLVRDPAIMYMADDFQKPTPFQPSVVIDIDDVIDDKLAMLHCHTSQMYEWLPYNWGRPDEVPSAEQERLQFTARWVEERGPRAATFLALLATRYGSARAARIRWIEAFEPCEYGRTLDAELVARLFPLGREHES